MKPLFTVCVEPVCVGKCVMERYCRCSLADRSWRDKTLTQVLIFTYWCIFPRWNVWGILQSFDKEQQQFSAAFLSFCPVIHSPTAPITHVPENLPKSRPRVSIHVHTFTLQSGILHGSGVRSRISDSVVSHMQLLWRGSWCSRDQSACVKGLATAWLLRNS